MSYFKSQVSPGIPSFFKSRQKQAARMIGATYTQDLVISPVDVTKSIVVLDEVYPTESTNPSRSSLNLELIDATTVRASRPASGNPLSAMSEANLPYAFTVIEFNQVKSIQRVSFLGASSTDSNMPNAESRGGATLRYQDATISEVNPENCLLFHAGDEWTSFTSNASAVYSNRGAIVLNSTTLRRYSALSTSFRHPTTNYYVVEFFR